MLLPGADPSIGEESEVSRCSASNHDLMPMPTMPTMMRTLRLVACSDVEGGGKSLVLSKTHFCHCWKKRRLLDAKQTGMFLCIF